MGKYSKCNYAEAFPIILGVCVGRFAYVCSECVCIYPPCVITTLATWPFKHKQRPQCFVFLFLVSSWGCCGISISATTLGEFSAIRSTGELVWLSSSYDRSAVGARVCGIGRPIGGALVDVGAFVFFPDGVYFTVSFFLACASWFPFWCFALSSWSGVRAPLAWP